MMRRSEWQKVIYSVPWTLSQSYDDLYAKERLLLFLYLLNFSQDSDIKWARSFKTKGDVA